MAWLSWAGLGIDRDERTALRRAGVVASDLAAMQPLDLVAATGELIDEDRAGYVCGRATLLQIMTPARADAMERVGVRDRADLASRNALELFRGWQHVSPYTNAAAYKVAEECIVAAGGPPPEPIADDDLVRIAWATRFGDRPDPTPTTLHVRLPSIDVNAPVVVSDSPPLDPHTVSVAKPDDPNVIVGHWQWAGTRITPFFRLEHIAHGDPIEVAGRHFTVVYVNRGLAPLEPPKAALVLIQPPHLRWPPWFTTWNLPADCDLERAWVQVAVAAEPAD